MIHNRLQGLSDEQSGTLKEQCMQFLKHQRLADDEVVLSRKLLAEVILTLDHARKFITSRNKMHPSGVELYDECLSKLRSKG